MFTADGLRPDSPHLMPPRGAASVFSLSLSLFMPLLVLSSHYYRLESSLILSFSYCQSLSLSPSCLSYSCRLFRVHSAPSLCLALFHELLALLTLLPTPELSCGQRKGGVFGPWKRERISARERIDFRKRQCHRKIYEMNGDERSRTRARLTLHI